MDYRSQFGEDKWIEEHLKPSIGLFCEVGAHDGLSSSNTAYFEQYHGWTGLLIEPIPCLAVQCYQNRPFSKVICCSVGAERLGEFNVNPQDLGASGLYRPGLSLPVCIIQLKRLIDRYLERCPDLLSIDTEGSELEVWESIGSHRPKIVIMEYRTFDEPTQDSSIVGVMKRDGYKEVHRTYCNLIFTLQ